MLESAVSSNSASLEFYAHLRQFDLAAPATKSALAYARTCRELLLRIASAWRCQRGFLAEGQDQVPGLKALFDLRCGQPIFKADTLTDPDGLAGLLSATATWFSDIYQPEHPLDGSYQVWVGGPGDTNIILCGKEHGSPPAGLRIEAERGVLLAEQIATGPIEAIGHYDVHGITMLALSLRTLRRHDASEATGVLSFEKTGDIGKLWKRTVPQAIRAVGSGGAVVMIDCPVHSRTPEHTLKALAVLDQVPGCELIIIDHHGDTLHLAPQLMRPNVQLVLTDVLGCGLYDPRLGDRQSAELQILGAIADKVPEVAQAYGPDEYDHLYTANEAFHQQLLRFSPTPPELKAVNTLPAERLWETLAVGETVDAKLAHELFGQPALAEALPRPAFQRCGAVLFITERLTILGRSWYALLEELMQAERASYAVALRVLDKNRANMLLLTHWKDTHAPPVRTFIPAEYWPRCLGHDAAVWVDLDKSHALAFLEQVTTNANHFHSLPCQFANVDEALRRNILEAPVQVTAAPAPAAPVQD